MFRLRSCASSMISVSYCLSSGSACDLREQDAVGHQLDRCPGPRLVGEADLVADDLAERRAQFLGDAARDARRRDAARLRMPDHAVFAASKRQADLRQLRGLARAGLAADDDDLMRLDGARDVLAPGRDRQFLGKGDGRQRRANPGPPGRGAGLGGGGCIGSRRTRAVLARHQGLAEWLRRSRRDRESILSPMNDTPALPPLSQDVRRARSSSRGCARSRRTCMRTAAGPSSSRFPAA